MKQALRWKKNPRPTGLAGVCSGHPGHSLNMGGEEYANAYEYSRRHSGKQGWYWVARGKSVPLYNSCNDEPLSEDKAKRAAMDYVKLHLANA
jgi:hypothetical protein